jgi:hypothetical protein
VVGKFFHGFFLLQFGQRPPHSGWLSRRMQLREKRVGRLGSSPELDRIHRRLRYRPCGVDFRINAVFILWLSKQNITVDTLGACIKNEQAYSLSSDNQPMLQHSVRSAFGRVPTKVSAVCEKRLRVTANSLLA